MRYGSMCSGIEAATKAWHPLGWDPVFFSEIEPFPSAVLNFHYSDVPNLGDMTKFESWPDYAIDVLVAGTPCQSFSVAGLRKGLDDARGNLMLVYGAVAQRYRPRWLAWENVPGVLSDDGGRSFASLLGLLTGRRVEVPAKGWRNSGIVPGYKGAYGLAWRVLDAQYIRVDGFGRAVPQRRRRLFVVGYFGDWRRAAAVLFEPESMRGDSPPRRQAGKNVAPTISARTKGGGRLGTDFDLDGGLITDEVSRCVTAGYSQRLDWETENFVAHVATTLPAGGNSSGGDRQPGTSAETAGSMLIAHPVTAPLTTNPYADNEARESLLVAHSLRAEGYDASEDGTGRGTPIIPVAPAIASTLTRGAESAGKGGYAGRRQEDESNIVAYPRSSTWAVRRLTPTECERLQGFPDDFTNIPWRGKNGAADGPRYKALGNSMAVNVMRWIGQRIQKVDKIEAA